MGLDKQAHEAWDHFLRMLAEQSGYYFSPTAYDVSPYMQQLYGTSDPNRAMKRLYGMYMSPLSSQYQLTREDMLNQANRANIGLGAQQKMLGQLGREQGLASAQAGAQMRQAASNEYLAQKQAELQRLAMIQQEKMNQLQMYYNAIGQKANVDLARGGMQQQAKMAEQQGWGDLAAGAMMAGGAVLGGPIGGALGGMIGKTSLTTSTTSPNWWSSLGYTENPFFTYQTDWTDDELNK